MKLEETMMLLEATLIEINGDAKMLEETSLDEGFSLLVFAAKESVRKAQEEYRKAVIFVARIKGIPDYRPSKAQLLIKDGKPVTDHERADEKEKLKEGSYMFGIIGKDTGLFFEATDDLSATIMLKELVKEPGKWTMTVRHGGEP